MIHSSTGLRHHVRGPYPYQGSAPVNLVAGLAGPRLREMVAVRSNSKGLRGGTSSGR